MKLYIYLCIAIVFSLSCCGEGEENDNVTTNQKGEIEYLPQLWRKSHIESGNWLDYSNSVGGNWIFNGLAIIPIRTISGTIELHGLELTTGEAAWKWSDFYNPNQEAIKGRFTIFEDNVLHWKTGKLQYWLDVTKGETVKKYSGDTYFNKYTNELNGMYYWSGIVTDSFPGLQIGGIFKGDFYDETLKLILLPNVDTTMTFHDRASTISSAVALNIEGEESLIVTWQKIFPPEWIVQSYLGLFNMASKEWVYNDIVLNEPSSIGNIENPLVKHNNTVITNIGTNLFCYDYLTGEKVWSRDFDHVFKFSGYEISEGILIANCENKILYGINLETGQTLWTGEGAGTSSRLHDRVLNGVLYFVGGSSGAFHAVDIKTGKTLWRLDPYNYEESNAYWNVGTVYCSDLGDDKNGYIIIQNTLNTYCFEAIR
jgi:hypothetical protein